MLKTKSLKLDDLIYAAIMRLIYENPRIEMLDISKELGISERTIYRIFKKFNLNRADKLKKAIEFFGDTESSNDENKETQNDNCIKVSYNYVPKFS